MTHYLSLAIGDASPQIFTTVIEIPHAVRIITILILEIIANENTARWWWSSPNPLRFVLETGHPSTQEDQ